MADASETRSTLGCLAVVVGAFAIGVFLFTDSSDGPSRNDFTRECIDRETRIFRARNPDGDMPDRYREEMIVACLAEGRQRKANAD